MKRTFFILLFVSLFLLITDRTIGFGLIRGVVQTIFAPIEVGLHELGLKTYDKIVFLLKLPAIYGENKELRKEVFELRGLAAENESLQEENKVLKEQLGVQIEGKKVEISAKVLGEESDGAKVCVLINQGEAGGVGINDVAVVRKFLVGKVVNVSKRQAMVLPVFSNESKVPVYVLSSDKKISGLAVGQYNSQVKLTEVLQDENFKIGDLVVTSGSAGVYPSGLLVGKVEKINKDKNTLFQEAELSMFWNMKELDNVFILK